MNITPITTPCKPAILAHFRLEMNAWELDRHANNPEELADEFMDGDERLRKKKKYSN